MSLASQAISAAKSAVLEEIKGAIKQAAIEHLQQLLISKPPAPKLPLPPSDSLGKPPAAGSMAMSMFAAAIKARNAAGAGSGSSAPVLQNTPVQKSGGDGWCEDPRMAGNDPNDPACLTEFHPNGSAASFEEWAEYLTGSKDPRDWADAGIDPWNYLDIPVTEPWWGSLFGGNMDEGYSMLWGLIKLGSPKYPGAGTHGIWWIPDELFGYDMSNLYAQHDAEAEMDGGPGNLPHAMLNDLRIYLQSIARARDPIHAALTAVYCIGLFPAMVIEVATSSAKPPVDA